MNDGDKRLIAYVGDVLGTICVVAVCLFTYMLGSNHGHVSMIRKFNRAGAETCAPYQPIHQFKDRGHELVVCRLPQGLAVREVAR